MLKVLMLRKRIDTLNAELAPLEERAASFQAREADLEVDISEASTAEEREVVEAAVDAFETERSATEARMTEIRAAITDLESQISEIEAKATEARHREHSPEHIEREDNTMPTTFEVRDLRNMNAMERAAFVAQDDVQAFLQRVRELRGQSRAVTGAELLIPSTILEIIRKRTPEYSQLLSLVKYLPVSGNARQPVAGTVPEAVWMECAGALNELELGFNTVEVDAFKVGGFVAVPNSILDDVDLALLEYLIDGISQSMGKAADRAVIYGTGTKQPVGIVTRLAASSAPAWWDTNQGAFEDLHTSNVLKLNAASSSGVSFFTSLISALGVASPAYSASGKPTWIMNRKTHLDILAKALAWNSAGALVSGANEMPVIGGNIVELECVGDFEIVGGFLDCYLMAERKGASVRTSDIPLMLQDQTVIVATQRMDGEPVVGKAFVVVSYDNTNPTTAVEFPVDYAGMDMNALTVTAAAGTAGKTVLTVSGKAAAGNALKYKVGGNVSNIKVGGTVGATTWSDLTSGTTAIDAATGTPIAVVELDGAGRVVSVGTVLAVSGT